MRVYYYRAQLRHNKTLTEPPFSALEFERFLCRTSPVCRFRIQNAAGRCVGNVTL